MYVCVRTYICTHTYIFKASDYATRLEDHGISQINLLKDNLRLYCFLFEGRIMAPKYVLVLILEAVSVTLHDKKDLADVIKLKLLRWGDDPGLPTEPGKHRVFLRGMKKGQSKGQKQKKRRNDVRKGHKPRHASNSGSQKRKGNQFPLKPP